MADHYVDFIRASGECICPACKLPYRKHPFDTKVFGLEDHNGVRQPFLRVLCDGTRVKL